MDFEDAYFFSSRNLGLIGGSFGFFTHNSRRFVAINSGRPATRVLEFQVLTDQRDLMNQNLIYYPCFAMLVLSAIVLLKMFRLRVKALKNGEVKINYFKTYNAGSPSHKMLQADRNFTNLFEVPTLFYMLCLFGLVTFKVDHFLLGAAWFYVLCRYLHSIVHITSNKIAPRMGLYALSWIALVVMGIKLAVDVWPSA